MKDSTKKMKALEARIKELESIVGRIQIKTIKALKGRHIIARGVSPSNRITPNKKP